MHPTPKFILWREQRVILASGGFATDCQNLLQEA